ncbi:hypothetical protein FRC12_011375 [Ceratobasidium sp. 428]|nr:hypothetical protein FRC12_011375 [Ceratobasidium sp. 428]
MLNYVASRKNQPEGNPLTEHMHELKYGVDDLTDLLSETRKLGIDTPETAQLESLSMRVYNFQQRAHRLLEVKMGCWDPDEYTVPLNILESAIDRILRFQRLGELLELERVVASLELSRNLQAVKINDLTLDQVDELILYGQRLGLSASNHRIMSRLVCEATSRREQEAYKTWVLAQLELWMKGLDKLRPRGFFFFCFVFSFFCFFFCFFFLFFFFFFNNNNNVRGTRSANSRPILDQFWAQLWATTWPQLEL